MAQTWLNNADAWVRAEPTNPDAQSSRAATDKAFDANHMPKGIE